jgi:hypothetical protein
MQGSECVGMNVHARVLVYTRLLFLEIRDDDLKESFLVPMTSQEVRMIYIIVSQMVGR